MVHCTLSFMGHPFSVKVNQVRVSTSIGISLTGEAARDPESLLRAADGALIRAKRAGKGRFVIDDALPAT